VLVSEPAAKPGTTPEAPISVHQVSTMVRDWVARLGSPWIEGQVVTISQHGQQVYIALRDTESTESVSVVASPSQLRDVLPPIAAGSRVLMQGKVEWWMARGDLKFRVLQIRAVGVGELLARLEALRNILAAEGLFAPERKKPLPFLPRRIGLICGRNSDAMHDVMKNAQRRWPDVQFEVREVAVQGAACARPVMDALSELDAIDDIDVIVITRGGGSFEDLLGFSDETLVRAVAAARTPVVAAIGHEEDKPLIDYVADFRASTPTAAAAAIVPDVVQETAAIRNARSQMRQTFRRRVELESAELDKVRSRPALANPRALLDERSDIVMRAVLSARRLVASAVDVRTAELAGVRSTLRALSPQGTLDRGYAIVRDSAGSVLSSVAQVGAGQSVLIRLSDGEVAATTQ
jgi:exodeoxyribonuclease VII large subunit